MDKAIQYLTFTNKNSSFGASFKNVSTSALFKSGDFFGTYPKDFVFKKDETLEKSAMLTFS
jgi:hypothetical protein